jgi:exopolyphosphatase/guanosine-5'-triphosphate,3'-diphosphate pyrophosphatase
LRELLVGSLIRLYARLSQRGFDIIPAQPELILLGYTETEIEVIANWDRYHRKNPPKKKHDNFVILTKKYREVVSKLHPFLRLAAALDRRQIGPISDFKCEHRPEVREFHLRLQPLNPSDDCPLELWSLDYKKSSFEDEYNLKLVATLE